MQGLCVFVVIALCLGSAFALVYPNGAEHIELEAAPVLFEQHLITYNKIYQKASIKKEKFANFQASIERVNRKNRQSTGAIFGMTKFSDMSTEEFKKNVLLANPLRNSGSGDSDSAPHSQGPLTDAPTSFDWRDKNAVTKVKDQKYKQCNDGWAMAPVETIESASIIAGTITNAEWLSTQQVVDCDPYADACGGGEPNMTYIYVQQAGGLESDADYPYEARDDGNCSFDASKIVAPMKSYQMNISFLHPNEQELQRSVLELGPVAVAVDADNWQDYKSGVMKALDCSFINFFTQVVQVVGYNATSSTEDADNTPYWIVRNSWGTNWGIDGYIYLEMWKDTCGLAHVISWPIV